MTKRTNQHDGDNCFACGRALNNPYLVDTKEDQFVYVGPECFKNIRRSGDEGWQPPQGGPRLYVITDARRARYVLTN